MIKNRPFVLLLLLSVILSQTACYNNYFISKNELQKLESSVEQKDVVTVYGDCPEGTVSAAPENAQAYRSLRGPLYAQAAPATDSVTDAAPASAPPAPAEETTTTVTEVVTEEGAPAAAPAAPEVPEVPEVGADAATAEADTQPAAAAAAAVASVVPQGCTAVDVSTANPLVIVTNNGDDLRVTPFNFIMSGKQIVSPEYDLLENIDDVKGAEVSEFSTWKTVALISGVAAAAIGAFVGISFASGPSSVFASK